jgi:aryl-alcohol dehydrogenase-like predicted oxidoreductase
LHFTQLGSSGLVVSRICLGCMSFGTRRWRPWMLERDEAMPFFRRAIELGINFFDTSDAYSLGVSEEITGAALREYGRLEELVIATKVRLKMSEGPNMVGLSRKHIVQGCEASLRRLGIETIDLYQIHRADARTPMEETLAALDHLVHSGKVRYLGASTMYAWQLMKMLSISERHGWARFVSMQPHYNLIYREEEREMIPLCLDQGVGVLPWSPHARGMLAGARKRGERTSSPRDAGDAVLFGQLYDAESDWAVVEATERVAASRGIPPARVALAWLLSRPGVVAPVVGVTQVAHVEEAVASLDVSLTSDEVAALEAPYQPHGLRGWYDGQPLPGPSTPAR